MTIPARHHYPAAATWASLLGAFLFGCSGGAITASSGAGGGPTASAAGTAGTGVFETAGGPNIGGGGGSAVPAPGSVALRRLNNVEYARTVEDWLGIVPVTTGFSSDQNMTQFGFDTITGASIDVSTAHIFSYEKAAEKIVSDLFDTAGAAARAGWCDYASGDAVADLACAQTIVSNFAAKAWRRGHDQWLGNDGLPHYQALLADAGPFAALVLEERLKAALQAILMGPRFLLRVEIADQNGKLDVPSIAARLSYMLWNSAPDDELLQSNLLDDAVVSQQLVRMQRTGAGTAAALTQKFERFVERFPDMWLELEKLGTTLRDREVFPDYTSAQGLAMREQTGAFFRRFVGLGDHPDYLPALSISQFLTADAPVVAELEPLYTGTPRRGLLTQAAILTLTGTPQRTSAVRRGKWVMERLLCAAPPDPPPEIKKQVEELLRSEFIYPERERLAKHREMEGCAGCHVSMDVIGLGLENYDAVGAYRTEDIKGNVIDPAGILPGATQGFANALELVDQLASDPRVGSCLAKQLLMYGTGRLYDAKDQPLINTIVETAGGSAATFQSILSEVLLSPAFRASTRSSI